MYLDLEPSDFLPKVVEQRLRAMEIEAMSQAIAHSMPGQALDAWWDHATKWSNAKLRPASISGVYLAAYFGPGFIVHQLGFSFFNKGWSSILTFGDLNDRLKSGKEFPNVPFDQLYLYWKGLSVNLN